MAADQREKLVIAHIQSAFQGNVRSREYVLEKITDATTGPEAAFIARYCLQLDVSVGYEVRRRVLLPLCFHGPTCEAWFPLMGDELDGGGGAARCKDRVTFMVAALAAVADSQQDMLQQLRDAVHKYNGLVSWAWVAFAILFCKQGLLTPPPASHREALFLAISKLPPCQAFADEDLQEVTRWLFTTAAGIPGEESVLGAS